MGDQVQDALLISVLLPTNNTSKFLSPAGLAAVLQTLQVLLIVTDQSLAVSTDQAVPPILEDAALDAVGDNAKHVVVVFLVGQH